MKWLAIINPRSGYEKDTAEIERLCAALRAAVGDDLKIKVTERIGHARALARRRDVEGFIAVGGDGTLADIVNGMDLDGQILGLMPAGTGNGLARDLGILDGHAAMARLEAGKTRPIDIVRVDVRFRGGEQHRWRMVSTASLGYAADVVDLASGSLKVLGPFCYPAASLLRAFVAFPFAGRWRLDEGGWNHLDASNVIVNNTRHAGNFEVFPEGMADDGALDVLVAKPGLLRQLLHNLSILSGWHFYNAGTLTRAAKVEIDLEEDRVLQLDGEVVQGVKGVSFSVEPGKLRIVA